MKQKIYILGLISAMILSTGVIFKMEHWPAAGIMITAGTLLMVLLFFPAALINNYKAEGNSQNRLLYIVTYITCFVVFIGILFKIMHWPNAGVALLIAVPFPYIVFLPVFLIVTSKNKNFNIYNTVFVLLLLAMNSVFSGLLSLNVSKETIDDSYNLSRNYNKVGAAMAQLPVIVNGSAVNMKIDEIIKITNDYQDLILKHEGMTRDQWKKDPGNLLRPDNINTAASILIDNGEMPPGMKLDKAITELIDLMKQTKGFADAAKALPAILDLDEEKGKDDPLNFYSRHIFIPLSWALIYLDGLEANLSMIKVSASAVN
ncbi:MAG TPA: hypothetical protein VFE71_11950 [Bacteroidales bacterium]|nr:hypothetical protein [Bacteroidales bacterium]